MSRRKVISQREARELQRKVARLESQLDRQRSAWASQWPGGVHLTDVVMAAGTSTVREVLTARKLGHAVVALPDSSDRIRLFALPLPGQPT